MEREIDSLAPVCGFSRTMQAETRGFPRIPGLPLEDRENRLTLSGIGDRYLTAREYELFVDRISN